MCYIYLYLLWYDTQSSDFIYIFDSQSAGVHQQVTTVGTITYKHTRALVDS